MSTAPAQPETPRIALFDTLRLVAADIKIAHSVFALPFALLAAFMAALGPTRGTYFVTGFNSSEPSDGSAHPFLHPDNAAAFWPGFVGHITLIILAMIFARTVAMLANRLLDRHIDAGNPRTAGRAIPSGKLRPRSAALILSANAAGFMLICVAFLIFYDNIWPVILGMPVLVWISSYALFKRFTWGCHLFLGSSLAISPIAAAIAIDPAQLAEQPALWMLSGMVLCWVAGFDIIYALQDVDIDTRDGLHSIPARFGTHGGLLISRGLHTISALLLLGILWIDPRMTIVFGIGAGVVITLLIYEQATVTRWGTSRIALTFFTLNGVISCLLGSLGIVDVLV